MGAAYSKEDRVPSSSSYSSSGLNTTSFFSKSVLSSISGATTTRCDAPAAPPAPPLLPPPLPDGSESESSAAPPPPPPDAGSDSIAEAAGAASAYTNPGPYEQVTMEARRLVTLDTYDGFRCDINKQLSPFMGVVHNFWYGTSMIPDGRNRTYGFVTQVADENGLMMARLDPERFSIDGRIHRALLGGLMQGKLIFGVSQEGSADQLMTELDFGGQTWTGNIKYGCGGGGHLYGCNYLQAITPKLVMGGEGMYISANQNLMSNYMLKYTMPAKTGEEESEIGAAKSSKPQDPNMPPQETSGSSTICVSFNTAQGMLGLNYKRVVTPNRVSLGADLQCSPFTLQSELLLGAEFKLTRSRLHFAIDGNLRLQSVVEAKLGMVAGSPQINFSADVDHLKDEMKFGYGINFEG